MEMHRDIVPELPVDTELLFSTDTCYNQGFYRKDSVLTFQGHPEYNDDIINKIVQMRAEMGILSADQAEDAHRRASERNDGPILAKAIVKFIVDGLE